MIIHYYGAAQTVTGSQHLLEINGKRLLLECGLFQGRRADTYQRNLNFNFSPESLDAVILSHAHIDHSGNLPNLVKQGYRGSIFATQATTDLADIMLQDSGHIHELDVIYVNKKRAKKALPPVEPLYTAEDAARVAELFVPVDYGEAFQPVKGVKARLLDAGHILGSAGVALEVQENGKTSRVWFSGDIGREKLPLLRDPVLPEAADYLIMECTYGDKPHRDPELAYQEFRDVVVKTYRRGGKVIVPAFAVGRTQELVYGLSRMVNEGHIPHIPVYVDSPLAVNASDIFTRHAECFDEETHAFIREHRAEALDFPGLTYIRSVDESKALNDRKDPMVIISASGMAESGRILHHLRNNIENPKNMIVIVSWQSPETLGRRLSERATRVSIFGEEFERRAEIATIGGLSAHAGQDMLVKYALAVKKTVKKIVLVHGEEKAARPLREKLEEVGLRQVEYPAPGDQMEF
jgi:metallo-beta-lactamase family protein